MTFRDTSFIPSPCCQMSSAASSLLSFCISQQFNNFNRNSQVTTPEKKVIILKEVGEAKRVKSQLNLLNFSNLIFLSDCQIQISASPWYIYNWIPLKYGQTDKVWGSTIEMLFPWNTWHIFTFAQLTVQREEGTNRPLEAPDQFLWINALTPQIMMRMNQLV